MTSVPIFDFKITSDTNHWTIVDDVVMGGKSSGKFTLNKEGNGVFEGDISLENNGGFSLLRYRFNKIGTKQYSKIILKVKGDGKTYQFRIKSKTTDDYAYISFFNTSKDWETITVSLASMYPAFRGRKLNFSNYDQESIEEIAFLIGNKKEENFKLEIDSIVLK
ncbi:CIA30 family protein [Maribacter hydrothermalis]|uniref:NADH:ubiquinone oxidoreductase n=1 Tax=Maribacter hydrothermalis TaxID=1836467 RepID=A0A1B7ZCX6_9FLAO|nr:CIA30 family protein [Maribacter hydrothermalis]APQ18612.1 CIA30 family protein [Maribacter hydrothermalis]OBR40832.1 NADH:ubiquinone oxidoreductase [Maribacter hydrothermalis]